MEFTLPEMQTMKANEMIREEAIAILIHEIDEDPFLRTEYREQIHEALKMAIKALEQTDVLDKIRTEIEHIEVYGRVDEHTLFCRTAEQVKDKALEIIDKYRVQDMIQLYKAILSS